MNGQAGKESEGIRVVPMYQPERINGMERLAEDKAAIPKLSYRGGSLMTNVEVTTIFWGESWQSGSLKDMVPKINAFFESSLASALMDQLQEYSVNGQSIGKGKLSGSFTIAEGSPASSITDSQLRKQLLSWIGTLDTFPKPGSNILYFIYLENGISVSQGGSKSCSSFCGYHNNIGPDTFYAVMPYPSCSGCLGKMEAFDALTATSSHELCEAITDPVPGEGWYDDTHGEIGDICAWNFKTIDGYQVQLEWSNKQNKCV